MLAGEIKELGGKVPDVHAAEGVHSREWEDGRKPGSSQPRKTLHISVKRETYLTSPRSIPSTGSVVEKILS